MAFTILLARLQNCRDWIQIVSDLNQIQSPGSYLTSDSDSEQIIEPHIPPAFSDSGWELASYDMIIAMLLIDWFVHLEVPGFPHARTSYDCNLLTAYKGANGMPIHGQYQGLSNNQANQICHELASIPTWMAEMEAATTPISCGVCTVVWGGGPGNANLVQQQCVL